MTIDDDTFDELDFDAVILKSLEEYEPEPFDEAKEFGKFIKAQREEQNLSQAQLSIDSGLSIEIIRWIEQGQLVDVLSAETIHLLATALKLNEYRLSLQAGRIPEEMQSFLCGLLDALGTSEQARKVLDVCWVAQIVGGNIVIQSNNTNS